MDDEFLENQGIPNRTEPQIIQNLQTIRNINAQAFGVSGNAAYTSLIPDRQDHVWAIVNEKRRAGQPIGSLDFKSTGIDDQQSIAIWKALFESRTYTQAQYDARIAQLNATTNGLYLPMSAYDTVLNGYRPLSTDELAALRGHFETASPSAPLTNTSFGTVTLDNIDTTRFAEDINAMNIFQSEIDAFDTLSTISGPPSGSYVTINYNSMTSAQQKIWDKFNETEYVVDNTDGVTDLDSDQRVVLQLQQNPHIVAQIQNAQHYTTEEAIFTAAYRHDLDDTGSRLISPLAWARRIQDGEWSRDRYLNSDFFDYALKYFELRMFSKVMLEMYNSSRLSVFMSLAQKVANGGLKQSSNICSDFVTDAASRVMSHYSSQLLEVQNWQELKASLNTQRFQADKQYDRTILLVVVVAIVGTIFSFKAKKGGFSIEQITAGLQIIKQVTEFLIAAIDASEENKIEENDDENKMHHEKSSEGNESESDSGFKSGRFKARGGSSQSSGSRRHSGDSNRGTSTKGVGFNHMAVNMQEKMKSSRQIRQFSAAMKAMVDASKSESEIMMMMAEMLGGITSSLQFSRGMGMIIDTAKSTSMRILDNRFKREELIVRRHNEIQDAHTQMVMALIMTVITLGAEFIFGEFSKGDKLKSQKINKGRLSNFAKGMANRKTLGTIMGMILYGGYSATLDRKVDQLAEDSHSSSIEGEETSDDGSGMSGIEKVGLVAESAESHAKQLQQLIDKLSKVNEKFAGEFKKVMKQIENSLKSTAKNARDPKSHADTQLKKAVDRMFELTVGEMDSEDVKEETERQTKEQVEAMQVMFMGDQSNMSPQRQKELEKIIKKKGGSRFMQTIGASEFSGSKGFSEDGIKSAKDVSKRMNSTLKMIERHAETDKSSGGLAERFKSASADLDAAISDSNPNLDTGIKIIEAFNKMVQIEEDYTNTRNETDGKKYFSSSSRTKTSVLVDAATLGALSEGRDLGIMGFETRSMNLVESKVTMQKLAASLSTTAIAENQALMGNTGADDQLRQVSQERMAKLDRLESDLKGVSAAQELGRTMALFGGTGDDYINLFASSGRADQASQTPVT